MRGRDVFSRCLLGLAVGLITVPLVVAQDQGQGGGGQAGSTGGSQAGNTGGSGSESTGGGQQQQQSPDFRLPIFLQGEVKFKDGTPAPPNVVIERVCAGGPIPEDYTDSNGRFSFQVGQNQQMVAVASNSELGNRNGSGRLRGSNMGGLGRPTGMPRAGGEITERDLRGCELRANLPGYRSTSVDLTGHGAFDKPDVGTIILSMIAGVSGLTISTTTLQAPKKARKAYEKGVKEAENKKWEKAEKELNKATTVYPEYAVAWQTLGQVYEAQQRPAEARKAYSKALAADDKFITPYIQLALMDSKEQKWQEVADATNRVLKMNPFDFPDAYFYNSLANLNLKQLTAAEKSAREAIKLKADQRFPQVENVLGIALAQQGNYAEASEHLKKYLELVPDAGDAELVRRQITQLDAAVAQRQPAQTPQQ